MKKFKVFLADADSVLVNNLAHKLRKQSNVEFIYSSETNLDSQNAIRQVEPDLIALDMVFPMYNEHNLKKDSNIDLIISKRLTNLGMPSGLSGYRYLISAIKMVLSDENALDSVTKILYPGIAKKHKSTAQRVEKAMRHAIKVTFTTSKAVYENGYNFFVKDGRDYPTNSHFIAEMYRHIRLYPNL